MSCARIPLSSLHGERVHSGNISFLTLSSSALDPQSLPGDLNILRRVWKRTRLPIPSEWTVRTSRQHHHYYPEIATDPNCARGIRLYKSVRFDG